MRKRAWLGLFTAISLLPVYAAQAQSTTTSPTGGPLPSGVTPVGGIVTDLQGANGNRVVAQVAASTLFVGDTTSASTLIGTQSGFDAGVIAALGGGLTGASFRISLFDGDSAAGNFDFNDNVLLVDGVNVGNFSSIATIETNPTGTSVISTGSGFANNRLFTGFFAVTDALILSQIFSGLGNGSLTFTFSDADPADQFLDFTQGIDGGLINVGSGPVVQPPTGAIPEPGTWAMLIAGFGMVGGAIRAARRKRKAFVTA